MATASPSPFTPAFFDFFRELRANNDKAWFDANRARYEEDVLEPSKAFVLAFRPHLREISPHFQAEPRVQGGSLFRIHANRRFNKDRPPYKQHAGLHFRHATAGDVHAPGFYLHLEPETRGDEGGEADPQYHAGGCFVGVGTWRPERDALKAIRDAIIDDPDAWTAASRDAGFRSSFDLTGDALKRGPAGYDLDHPLMDDIKRKDFIGGASVAEADVTADGFVEDFAARCRSAAPFVRWLCGAVGAPF